MSDERTCENCKWYLAKTKACTNSDSDNAAGAVKKDDTCIYHTAKIGRDAIWERTAKGGLIECND